MTIEQCLAFCGQTEYAGLEYGSECWCDDMLNAYALKLTDADCSLTCTGDETQICGGPLRFVSPQYGSHEKILTVALQAHYVSAEGRRKIKRASMYKDG